MENKEISIKEKFKIDDSHSKIRGVVCAYDKNGELIFEKENMIVESGRRYIMEHGITGSSFKYAFIGECQDMVEPTDTLNTVSNRVNSDKNLTNSILLNKDNFENISVNSCQLITGYDELNPPAEGEISVIFREERWTWSSENTNIFEIHDSIENGTEVTFNDKKYIWNNGEFNLKDNPDESLVKDTTEIRFSENQIWDGGDYFIRRHTILEEDTILYNGKVYKFSSEDGIFKKFIDNNILSYFINDDTLVINCFIIFSGNESVKATTLGLVVEDYFKTNDTTKNDNKTYYVDKEGTEFTGAQLEDGTTYYEYGDVLFSRVTFPVYFKSIQQRLTFKYYIYF